MNYIPGFSNYLQTAIPRYANGGPVMDDVTLTPEQRAARRAAANARPQGTFLAAPTDNLGKGTGYDIAGQGSNRFSYQGGPIRVTDRKGNVLFSGEGPEAALEAVKFAQNLSDTKGKNASWDIQQGERTINPDGSVGGLRWVSGPSDAREGMGVVGDLASFALPIAAAIATAGMSIPAQMAAAAAAGGIGGVMAGKDPLKQALLSGATAGIMGGSGANEAISGALGKVGGTVAAKTAGELGKQAAAEAGEQIVVTGLSKALQGAGSAIGNTLLSEGVKGGLSGVTGYKTPSEQFLEQQTPVDDTIVVSGDRLASGSGLPFAAAVPIPINAMLSGELAAAQQTPAEKTAEDIEAEKNPIVVDAPTNLLPADFATSAAAAAAANAANGMGNAPDRAEMTDEELDAYMNDVSKGGGLGSLLSDMTLAQKINLLGLGVSAVGSLAGGKGGTGQTGTYTRGGGSLNPLFSAKLPAAGGLGAVGATRTARPMGDQDWLTYGTRPELNFFDYSAQPANPAPITTPIPNEPRGPSMYVPDTTRFAKGGRAEFAVNGPGTGRSDDIPAVLSDGEYVIDAETVALLGDGSSKAGAKKLDELRVKVRKHKGKKLAKGRFSANAKKPEHYMAGGLT